jgi:hypothetical protein
MSAGNFWNPDWNGDIVAGVAVRRSVSGLAGKPRDEVADHVQGDPSERNLFIHLFSRQSYIIRRK